MLPAFLATLLFSFSTICGHRSARLIGGAEANFWRLSVGALLLGCWSYSRGVGLGGDAFPIFLVSGLIGIGIGDVAWFQALPRLGSRISVLLVQCLMAPMAAIIESVWLGTILGASQVLWGSFIVAGVAVALKPGEHFKWREPSSVAGLIFCFIAATGTAVGAVLSRKAYQVASEAGQHVDGGTAAFQRIMGGLVIAGLFLLVAKRQMFRVQSHAPRELVVEISRRKWRGVWLWVLLNAVAGQALGVSCMQWALETTPTGIVLAIIAMTPIAVIPLAMLFENERPNSRALAGAAIAVTGIIGLTLSRL